MMKEQLSAIVDGEESLASQAYLYKKMQSDHELQAAWQSYHIIGDVMRGNTLLGQDFQQRLLQALDEQPTVIAPAFTKQQRPWLSRQVSLLSMAASVAAVGFVAWVTLSHTGFSTDNSDTTVTLPRLAENNLTNEYLAVHQAYAPGNVAYYIQPANYSENAE